MSETSEERRKRIQAEVAQDLRKPIEQLLTDVHEESVRAWDPQAAALARTMARFASLLSVLAIQAEIQTRRIVRLTWLVFWLTLGLLVLTAALTYYASCQSKRDGEAEHRQSHQSVENLQLTVHY